jgi:tetratricopeptide (TPR) repeat protein
LEHGAKSLLTPRSGRKDSDDAGTDALLLLRLLDQIAEELEDLEQRGVDLRAERGRFETVLNQLRRRERSLVALAGAEMPAQRPPDARWWWVLNEKVAADRKRRLKRVIGVTLIGLAVLSVLYLLYDRFLAPPPNVRQASSFSFEGERAAIEGDPTRAIEQFEAAVALQPDRAEAHVWLGVLYESTGNGAKAALAFEQAQAFLDSRLEFLVQRGLLYLALSDFDAANQDANAAIELAPQRPEGYFLLGNVAEQVGDLELALDSFQQAADLAESTGQVTLQVTARVRMATVLQRLATMPQP